MADSDLTASVVDAMREGTGAIVDLSDEVRGQRDDLRVIGTDAAAAATSARTAAAAAERAAGNAASAHGRVVDARQDLADLRADLARRCPTPREVPVVRLRPWLAGALFALALIGLAVPIIAVLRACRAWPVAVAGFDEAEPLGSKPRPRLDGGTTPAPPAEPAPVPDPDRDARAPDKVPAAFHRWINCNGSPREDAKLCPSLQRKRRVNP